MLSWVLKLIELKNIPMKGFLDSSEVVRYACLKPQLLGELKEWELLESGLQSNIKIQNEDCGLLIWLCYANVNIPPASPAEQLKENIARPLQNDGQLGESVAGPSQNDETLEEIVGKLIKSTKEDFLHGPFNGYSAWHYSQQHGNIQYQQNLTSRFQYHYAPRLKNYALKIVHEIFRKMP